MPNNWDAKWPSLGKQNLKSHKLILQAVWEAEQQCRSLPMGCRRESTEAARTSLMLPAEFVIPHVFPSKHLHQRHFCKVLSSAGRTQSSTNKSSLSAFRLRSFVAGLLSWQCRAEITACVAVPAAEPTA